jgi:galactokinase
MTTSSDIGAGIVDDILAAGETGARRLRGRHRRQLLHVPLSPPRAPARAASLAAPSISAGQPSLTALPRLHRIALHCTALRAGPLCVGDVLDEAKVQRRLQRRGLDAATAAGKAPLFAAAARALGYDAAASPAAALAGDAHALFVPGRIEVMGKHTDYCGGRSLLGAINKGFCVVATPRADDAVRVVTLEPSIPEADRSVTLSLAPRQQSAAQAQAAALPAGHWSNYVACTVRRVSTNFPGLLRGLDMAIGCDLPPASGMSTSSAMICAVFKALAAVSGAGSGAGAGGGLERSARFRAFLGAPERLYEYLGCIENGQSFVCAAGVLAGDKGVGTFGGSEDHTAIMACEAGSLKMYSYCPTRLEATVPFPEDCSFVIAVSGAVAEKTGARLSDYNNAALLSFAAAKAWCAAAEAQAAAAGHAAVPESSHLLVRAIQAAADEDIEEAGGAVAAALGAPGGLAHVAGAAPWGGSAEGVALLQRRAAQFFEEQALTQRVARALADRDFASLREAVARSQQLTDTHLNNLVPETRFLPRAAHEIGGGDGGGASCLAASAFGAGFGGSAYAVVRTAQAEVFARRWRQAYQAAFPEAAARSQFFAVRPGPGAFQL